MIKSATTKIGEGFGIAFGQALATATLVIIGQRIGKRFFTPAGPGTPPGTVK